MMTEPLQTDRRKVSVLIPVYNEQAHIMPTLESIAAQDYAAENIEIVVAHGESTDRTAELLQTFRRDYPSVKFKLLNNPTNNTAVGRNLCLQHADGGLVLNFSGHAVADKRLVSVLASKLADLPDDVAGIGCAIRRPAAQSVWEDAIGTAMLSSLGGMKQVDSAFHAQGDQPARSIAFTLYKKEILDGVGGFDESFWCGQDAELNLRLAQNGHAVWFTPDTFVEHYKRTRLSRFASQMYRYGVARAKITKKFPRSFRAVFLLPSLFVLTLVAGTIAAAVKPALAVLLLIGAALFSLATALSTLAAGGRWRSVLLSPIIFCCLYVAYGTGFCRGLLPARKAS